MKRVFGIKTSSFITRYGEYAAAAAEFIPELFIENILDTPIEKGSAYIHLDPHAGNARFHEPTVNDKGEKEIDLVFLDWGIAAKLDSNMAQNILLLVAGAGINLAELTADALWGLRNKNFDEKQDLNEVRKRVKAKMKELSAKRAYWEPQQWIEHFWAHQILEFPDDIISLESSLRALTGLHKELGKFDQETGAAEFQKIFTNLEKVYEPKVLNLMKEKYLKLSPLKLLKTFKFWFDALVAKLRYRKHSCELQRAKSMIDAAAQASASHLAGSR